MAKLYFNLITNPKTNWTIDMVPQMWRVEVEKMLEANE